MVDAAMKEITRDKTNSKPIVINNYKIKQKIDVLDQIIMMWESIEKNTLHQYILDKEPHKNTSISDMLGIGMKKRHYNPEGQNMKQKYDFYLPKCRYDN